MRCVAGLDGRDAGHSRLLAGRSIKARLEFLSVDLGDDVPWEATKAFLQVVRRDRIQNSRTRKVREWVGFEVREGYCGSATLQQVVARKCANEQGQCRL